MSILKILSTVKISSILDFNLQLCNIFVYLCTVLVDLTEPVAGEVVDGSAYDFTDLQFTTSQAKVELQWRNYYDPESNISRYDVKVYRAK